MFNRFFFWLGLVVLLSIVGFIVRQRSTQLKTAGGFDLKKSVSASGWWLFFGIVFLLVGLGAFQGCPDINYRW